MDRPVPKLRGRRSASRRRRRKLLKAVHRDKSRAANAPEGEAGEPRPSQAGQIKSGPATQPSTGAQGPPGKLPLVEQVPTPWGSRFLHPMFSLLYIVTGGSLESLQRQFGEMRIHGIRTDEGIREYLWGPFVKSYWLTPAVDESHRGYCRRFSREKCMELTSLWERMSVPRTSREEKEAFNRDLSALARSCDKESWFFAAFSDRRACFCSVKQTIREYPWGAQIWSYTATDDNLLSKGLVDLWPES